MLLLPGLMAVCLPAFGQWVEKGESWKDPKSGLLWTKTDSGEPMNWENAGKYCKALSTGNSAGWRMPSLDEMKALYRDTHFKSGVTLRSDNATLWTADKSGDKASAVFFWQGSRFSSVSLPVSFSTPVTLCVNKKGFLQGLGF